MSRILSLALFVFGGVFFVLSMAVMAQDGDSCKKCQTHQTTEIEVVGVDFRVADAEQKEASCQQASSKKKEIAIHVECECNIPFLKNLPYINHMFQNAPTEECEIFVFDEPDKARCGICKEGCTFCCEQCQLASCSDKPNGIEIEITCDGGSPLLKNIPYVNQLFKNVGVVESPQAKECQGCDCPEAIAKATCPAAKCGNESGVFVFESSCDNGCQTCQDGCPSCCEESKPSCCPDKAQRFEFEVAPSLSGIPFLSNSSANRQLFTNVGVVAVPATECQDCDCRSACEKTACPATVCGTVTCETPACRSDALLKLASYHDASIEATGSMREELMEQLMEVQVENVRLEVTVEAMESHMELMEEMFEIRVENAALKARLEMMEQQKATSTSFNHSSPQPIPGANKPYVVMGMAHPAHAAHSPHGLQGNKPTTGWVDASAGHGHGSIFSQMHSAKDMQRMTEQVRKFQKELERQHGENSKK